MTLVTVTLRNTSLQRTRSKVTYSKCYAFKSGSLPFSLPPSIELPANGARSALTRARKSHAQVATSLERSLRISGALAAHASGWRMRWQMPGAALARDPDPAPDRCLRIAAAAAAALSRRFGFVV